MAFRPIRDRSPGVAAALTAAVILAACGGGVSRYQGVPPEQIFAMADTAFQDGSYDDAIEALDRIVIAHGDWDRLPEARLMLGHSYFEKGDYLTARVEYQRFIDRYAGHASSADASLGICRSLAELAPRPQRDQGYTQEAMGACRNTIVDFAGRDQAVRAAEISNGLRLVLAEKEYNNADFYFRRGMYDSAIKYYEFVVTLYSESEFAPQALLGIYHSNQAIGYDDLADVAREQLLRDYPDSAAAESIRSEPSGSTG